METVLVTGGAGFVGSNLALRLKERRPASRVVALDNLKRRGSELNLPRLREGGVEFRHGDIRNAEDLEAAGEFSLMIECSAEPSVLAGYGESPAYLINSNLMGSLNCLEAVRRRGAGLVFLSTSRVYPMVALNALDYREGTTRFELKDGQKLPGAGPAGISETFPLDGTRSLYGATKLASELMIQEYAHAYGIPAVIDRCGVLTGPWQMGKVDQGVVVLWAARHLWGGSLSYIGYGGAGRQVRDILSVDDLYGLVEIQIGNLARYRGDVFNVGGGPEVSVSLRELTDLCREATGRDLPIGAVPENRNADIPYYITDNAKVRAETGWKPSTSPREIIGAVVRWLTEHERSLKPILS
jgi:CDP-paratose 2-epimerase